jgi:succinate dehydrogenase/fumarate reductase flavoprotein subunit
MAPILDQKHIAFVCRGHRQQHIRWLEGLWLNQDKGGIFPDLLAGLFVIAMTETEDIPRMRDDRYTCDLLVVGAGAGGFAAAVTAAWLGLDVILIEKCPQVGGTSAWSGGYLWIPRNFLARAAGVAEDFDVPATYLRHEAGARYDEALANAFLVQGPKMLEFFRKNTDLQFIDGNAIPDFHCRVPGSATGGRAIGSAPFDGRLLGEKIKILKPPLDLVAPFGMGIAAGADLRHFFSFTRHLASCVHVTRRVLRHALDCIVYGRGMHLVNGNALIARLLKSAERLNVRIFTSAPAESLIFENGTVVGIQARLTNELCNIRANRGVVLATGGFPHDVKRKAELFAHAPTGREHWSAAPETNTGDGLRLGESVGGDIRRDFKQAGGWAPVSLVPRKDGTIGHFPHLVERAKPGLIMVRADGKRFCNEADSYHDVMSALFALTPRGALAEAWMICDHKFLRRYGLGRARPRPFPVRPWIGKGYLKSGRTLGELAQACGIDSAALEETVRIHNDGARVGVDSHFGRGEEPINRATGEPDQKPNPCLAPIERAPFYALRVVAGSLSTFAGLRTDASARVLDSEQRPIAGLYAVGNDMASIMGGEYPAGGFTLGPAMTFGYIAAHDASGVPLDNNRS